MDKAKTSLLLLLALVPLFPAVGMGQSTNATITGSVTDQSGGAIPNAHLALTAVSTQVTYHATAGHDGLYSFPNLQAGSYDLHVVASGFREFVQKGITANINETVTVPVSLELGTTTQTVEVLANASPLNFQNAEVKGVLTPTEIEKLPLLMQGGQRSAAVFVTLMPGVNMGPSGSTDSGMDNTHINGGEGGYADEATLDGVSLVEGLLSQSGLVSIHGDFPISPEAVGEISELTSNFDVQFGASASAVTTAVTKSGTNEFHGKAYEYLRNTDLNARSFGTTSRSSDQENDFGALIGGPFKAPFFWSGRKKTYFFVNFEGYRGLGGTTTPFLTVPDALMREGNFSEWPQPIYDPATTEANPNYNSSAPTSATNLPYLRQQFMGCDGSTPNVICSSDPRLASSLAQDWLKYVPMPTSSGLANNYEDPNRYTGNGNSYTDQWDVRADQYLGEKDHIMVTWHYRGTLPFIQNEFPPVIDTLSSRIPNYSEIGRLNYDHTFSGNLLNHFAVGYLDLLTQVYDTSDCCVSQVPEIAGVYNHNHEPALTFGSTEYSGYGGNSDMRSTRPAWEYYDMLTWIHNKHNLKFGGEIRRLAYADETTTGGSGSFAFSDLNTGLVGIPSGNSMASFLLGEVSSASVSYYSLPAFRAQNFSYGVFVGDTWKITPKLTLSPGLRWDVFFPSVEGKNHFSFFDPTAPNPGAGNLPGTLAFAGTGWGAASYGGRHPEQTSYKSIAPRLSFAYALSPKTVIRSGYGIFFEELYYDNGMGGIATDGFNLTQAFSSTLSSMQPAFLLQDGVPQTFQLPPFITSTYDNGKTAPTYRPRDAGRPSYTQQWNLDVQHQVTNNFYWDVMYLGNKGTRLPSMEAGLNVLNPSLLSMGSSLNDQFTTGETTLDGVNAPYPGWAAQMSGCPPTVAQALLPYPQYCGNIFGINENDGDSTYESLQAKAQNRFSHGLFVLTSYTLSKNITTSDSEVQLYSINGMSPFQRNREKALNEFDIPQILAVSLVYDLPFGAGKYFVNKGGPVDRVIGGWHVNSIIRAQSPVPFFFRDRSFCNVPSQFGAACIPSILPGANPFAQPKSAYNPSEPLFTAASFQPASTFNFNFGDGARMSNVRGFGYHNVDFGLMKDTKITEKATLEFRFDAFNIFNLHIFSIPGQSQYVKAAVAACGPQPFNCDPSSPTFGQWTKAVTIPRNMQAGLKLIF